MQGTIAQSVGLTLAVNAIKRGLALGPFWPDASIFQFCRDVRFFDPEAKLELAGDPREWVAHLPGSARGAIIHAPGRADPAISDRMSVGFVGGGNRWLIEAVGEASSDLWEAGWQVVDSEAPDRRIWGVEYFRIARNIASSPMPSPDLRHAAGELERALIEILDFARAEEAGFIPSFEHGLAALRDPGGCPPPYHADMASPGLLTEDAQRLLSAVQGAWVFGGMGSWNDMWFDGEAGQRYAQVSDALYHALVGALAAAANSSFPSAT